MAGRTPERGRGSPLFAEEGFDPNEFLLFIESSAFKRAWERCSLTDDDLFELQTAIMTLPKSHPVIVGTDQTASTRDQTMSKRTVRNNAGRTRSHEPTVEQDVLDALAEFSDALEKGDVQARLTCRRIRLDLKMTAYTPKRVKETRDLLKVSQTLFARFLGVSSNTVRSWEQGASTPSPIACRFMDEIRRDPAHWLGRLREMALTA